MSPPSEPDRPGDAPAGEVTRLLHEASNGSQAALQALIPLVYDDLRRIAHRRLQSERADHTLDTTAVVHEAYIRLLGHGASDWHGRAHFFAVAARVMRNILVDYARRRQAGKRGGGVVHLTSREEEGDPGEEPELIELLALDQALTRLAHYDASLERVVECRFFAGMTVDESAAALGVSRRTVERQWNRARAYLYQALRQDPDPAGPQAEGSPPS